MMQGEQLLLKKFSRRGPHRPPCVNEILAGWIKAYGSIGGEFTSLHLLIIFIKREQKSLYDFDLLPDIVHQAECMIGCDCHYCSVVYIRPVQNIGVI